MTQPPPSAPRSARARRTRRALLYLALGAAALGLLVVVGLHVARGIVTDRLQAVAYSRGVHLEIGAVSLPLAGPIGIEGLRLTDAESGALLGTIARVTTDLSIWDGLAGARRPARVLLSGADLRVRFDASGPALPKRAPGRAEGGGEGGGPLQIAFEDARLTVEGALPEPAVMRRLAPLMTEGGEGRGLLSLPEVRAEALGGELSRRAEGGWRMAARGRIEQEGGPEGVAFSATIDEALRLDLTIASAEPFLRVETDAGPLWAGLGALTATASAPMADLTAERGVLRGPRGELAFEALGVDDLGALVDRVRGRGAGSVAIGAEGLTARREGQSVAIGALTLEVETEDRASVTVKDSRLAVDDPRGTVQMSVPTITARLEGLDGALRARDPLASVSALVLTRPELSLLLPPPEPEPPAVEGETPPPRPAEGMPLMPGDDPSMGDRPDTADPAAGRESFAGLDHLLDTIEGRLGRIDALLAGRAGGMMRRASRLKPEIQEATARFAARGGDELFTLRAGGLALTDGGDGALEIRFESRVERGEQELGRISLTAGLDAEGRLDTAAARLEGQEVASRLAALLGPVTVQADSVVDLDLRYARPRSPDVPHHLTGRFRFQRFSFSYWRISDRPLTDLEGDLSFEASLDLPARRLLLKVDPLRVGEARFAATVDLRKPSGLKPSVTATLRMPRQDCGLAAASIPRSLIPNLRTLRLRGHMHFDAELSVDLEKPRELSLRVRGEVDGCEVLSLDPDIRPHRLLGRFVHHPREPGRGVLTHIAVGRGTREWIPSDEIPPIVKHAAWVTEDRKWEDHGGVRWDLVATALRIDLDHGRFIYGGSTITQQLVKNLYLTRDKNLARKFEEMIIAWQMERELDKDTILTTYINCIEYGPDIYGIRAAAAHYFGKAAQDLDALEAAFIMGLKPYPKAGYRQWERGVLDKWWLKRVSYVLRLMHKYGPELLDAETLEALAPYQPRFRRPPSREP